MVNQPRKKMVYEDYVADVSLFPTLYTSCTQAWFNTVWRENYPEIRLRKHCRFTKCVFCVEWRAKATDRDNSDRSKLDAKHRLGKHIEWAHKKERGLYHDKRMKAEQHPATHISIAIDGTDRFPNGFPHFFEKTKSDDGMRLKLHTICVCVHGSGPYIYLAYENILSDPNLICEVLTRVLMKEELKRGSLPKNLYLQLDNCGRENKNTYLEKYVEWLVERSLHDEARVSFLPVGHTHFDPDQLASRISEFLKHRDVTSIDDLIRLLGQCYTPMPHVELIEDVLDWRKLINPENNRDFPIGTAMCRRARGICTKSVNPRHQYFMPETSPLHWFIRRDQDGHVFLQTQHTVLDDLRSQPVYHWDTEATRPSGRENNPRESGLLPSDLTLAARVPLTEDRKAELKKSLEGAKPRLTPVEIFEFDQIFEELCNPTPVDQIPLPEHHWTFRSEQGEQPRAEELEPLRLRPISIFSDHNDEAFSREQRQKMGHCQNYILVGNYVAYTTDYTHDVPDEKRNEFWLGVVLEVDARANLILLRRYNTVTFRNATNGQNAKYKPWNQDPTREWIEASRALCQFTKLTDKGNRIRAKLRKRIKNALTLAETEAREVVELAE